MSKEESGKKPTAKKVVIWLALLAILALLVGGSYYAYTRYVQSQRDTDRKSDIATIVGDTQSYLETYNDTSPADAFNVISDSSYTRKLKAISAIDWNDLDWNGIQPTKEVAVFSTKDCNGKSEAMASFSVTVLLEDGTRYCMGS